MRVAISLRTKLLLLSIVSFLLICSSLVISVEASSIWSQTYGGGGNDEAHSLIMTSDGGYALAGKTLSFGAGGDDFWLVKTDALGNMEWNRTYGGTLGDEAYSLVATADGGYALAGICNFTSPFSGSYDFWLVKTDALGNMEWNQTYGGTGQDWAWSLVATSDGGYAIAGYTSSFGAGSRDFWLVKTDAFGNMEWNRTYGGGGTDYAYSLVAASDGGYALAGGSLLVKTDASGNMEWNQTYEGSAYSLVATSDGGYAIAGWINSFGAGGDDFWLVKTDALGNMVWNQAYGGKASDEAYSLVATSDGGYILVGETDSFGAGGYDFWLVKTDASGNMVWNQTYGGTSAETAYSLVATADGYAIAGKTWSLGAGGADFWLVKTNEIGVVPEFSPWVIPLLVLTAVLFILVSKKRLLRTHSKVS